MLPSLLYCIVKDLFHTDATNWQISIFVCVQKCYVVLLNNSNTEVNVYIPHVFDTFALVKEKKSHKHMRGKM